jgi:hypothetical protein
MSSYHHHTKKKKKKKHKHKNKHTNKKNEEQGRCRIWSQKLQCDLSSMAFLCRLWKWTISLHSKWMRGG